MKRGIDVWKGQGDIQWAKVKTDGIDMSLAMYLDENKTQPICFIKSFQLDEKLKLDYDVFSTSYFSTSDTPQIEKQKIYCRTTF